MANLTVRREGGERRLSMFPEVSSLFRDLMRWDPFREIEPIIPAIETPIFSPQFDVKETKDAYMFKADIPGIREQDVEVTLTGTRLTVSGKREQEKEEKGETYYACERSYGAFTRSFTLPEGADAEHVKAELKDGVLTIVLAKKPELQPKKIDVKGEKVKA